MYSFVLITILCSRHYYFPHFWRWGSWSSEKLSDFVIYPKSHNWEADHRFQHRKAGFQCPDFMHLNAASQPVYDSISGLWLWPSLCILFISIQACLIWSKFQINLYDFFPYLIVFFVYTFKLLSSKVIHIQ